MAKAPTSETLNITPIQRGVITLKMVGETPLICHSMSLKAKQALLRPPNKARTDADRAARGPKHDPVAEYRDSINRDADDNAPTLVVMPATSVKGSMSSAALDLPDTRKSEIGRLVRVEGYQIPIWGIPALRQDIVRMNDIPRTPDVRTRACIDRWASVVTISFMEPKLTVSAIGTLLAAAGYMRGIGDWRMERGSADFGLWRVCADDDAEWHEIVRNGGRAVQIEAMKAALPYNAETEELLSWFQDEDIKAAASGPAMARAGRRARREEGAVIAAEATAAPSKRGRKPANGSAVA